MTNASSTATRPQATDPRSRRGAWAARSLVVLLVLGVVLLMVRCHVPAAEEYGPEQVGPDVEDQLRYLGDALRDGAGERMQAMFPEGDMFTLVLYGLAQVDVGLRADPGSPRRQLALSEARFALDRLDRGSVRRVFYEPGRANKPLDMGTFYMGWSTWLRGGVLLLQPPGARDQEIVNRFKDDCATLKAAYDGHPHPYIPTYSYGAWPADNVIAVAALRLHDHLFEPRHTKTIARWVSMVRESVEPDSGMIAHSSDPETGDRFESPRGSSMALMLRFLGEIDPELGRSQYRLFRETFVTTRLGGPVVLEYLPGHAGHGDIDSGPIIMGMSAPANVVAIGSAMVNGDRELANSLIHSVEVVGLPVTWAGKKRYALGLLPVGDAFLVWNKTARPWITPPAADSYPPIASSWWWWPLHAVALALIVLILFLGELRYWRVRPEKA